MSRVAPDDDDARASPTCAICLARPDARDVALVKACLHAFCASCVTKWAEFTRAGARTRCPLCQASCESVLVRRALDGRALEDGGMQEESLCLLRRARWATRGREGEGWDDGDEDGRDGSDGSDGSDALEEALMRGRARRLVLGNRKFGRGGVRVERRLEELRATDGERARERAGGDGGDEEETAETRRGGVGVAGVVAEGGRGRWTTRLGAVAVAGQARSEEREAGGEQAEKTGEGSGEGGGALAATRRGARGERGAKGCARGQGARSARTRGVRRTSALYNLSL